MKRSVLLSMYVMLVLWAGIGRAESPKISNLQFSDNPISLGESFTISFEFEGTVDRYFVENNWETSEGQMKREVKDYAPRPETKDKVPRQISFRWKTENPTAKPYRIFKIWAKDTNGNQSNTLTGEVKVMQDVSSEEVRFPMELKSVFGTKMLRLSGTLYKQGSGEKLPLVVMNHGTPRNDEDRKNVLRYKDQSKVFVKRGFVVLVPMRRGYGTSEGDYAEYSGKCDTPDYDNVAKEAVKDIRAAVEFMKRQPYIDPERKVLIVGQSAGGFSSLAYASVYPDEVAAVINFAGGKGSIAPFKVCGEERLVHTVGGFGKTSRMPTLWLYTKEDDYFPPPLSRKMHEAYGKRGGTGKFLLLSSEYGHNYFVRATRLWEPMVEEFLKEIQLVK
jgi:dienelactone hydrolase